jgi:hypothetical protein
MRKLYLVPIIHMSADMGSMASALDDAAAAKLTAELWQKHKETVSVFWDSIGQFFGSLDVQGFKIYQDGMIAEGEEGRRIVSEGVSRGSKNYEIVSRLLEKGSVLLKTESLSLVKQEYGFIVKMARAKSLKEKEVAAIRYKLARGRLLKQRDEYIAGRINETLSEGENGILFIGAYHNVIPILVSDIKVAQVKDVLKVREYHNVLLTTKRYDQYLQSLGEYLTSPISNIPPFST